MTESGNSKNSIKTGVFAFRPSGNQQIFLQAPFQGSALCSKMPIFIVFSRAQPGKSACKNLCTFRPPRGLCSRFVAGPIQRRGPAECQIERSRDGAESGGGRSRISGPVDAFFCAGDAGGDFLRNQTVLEVTKAGWPTTPRDARTWRSIRLRAILSSRQLRDESRQE